MLKKRIIPKFLLRDGRLVKYVRFHEQPREAGNPVSTAQVYNDYGADELILLDIAPSEDSRAKVLDILGRMSEQIFMPLTVGGGVRKLADVTDLLRAGAGMTVSGPDPRGSGGQYYLVMNGGLTYTGADYPLWSLLFIGPNDEPCTFTAGAAGVEVFIGQYPRRD